MHTDPTSLSYFHTAWIHSSYTVRIAFTSRLIFSNCASDFQISLRRQLHHSVRGEALLPQVFQIPGESRATSAGCSDGRSPNPWPSFGGSLRNVASPRAWQRAWPHRVSRPPFGLLSGFFLAISSRTRRLWRWSRSARDRQPSVCTLFSTRFWSRWTWRQSSTTPRWAAFSVSGMRITSFCR